MLSSNSLRAAWHLEGKFVVAYSGNLGRVHDLEPVLAVAETLRDAPDIAFVFIGGGARRDPLQAQAADRGLRHVHFSRPSPATDSRSALALGDVHATVTLLAGCERLVFPSKLYGVTAVGRPVIFIGPRDCEIARLVTERGLGRAFARDEVAAIAAAIRQLSTGAAQLAQFRAAAEVYGRSHSGPDRAAAHWQKLLVCIG